MLFSNNRWSFYGFFCLRYYLGPIYGFITGDSLTWEFFVLRIFFFFFYTLSTIFHFRFEVFLMKAIQLIGFSITISVFYGIFLMRNFDSFFHFFFLLDCATKFAKLIKRRSETKQKTEWKRKGWKGGRRFIESRYISFEKSYPSNNRYPAGTNFGKQCATPGEDPAVDLLSTCHRKSARSLHFSLSLSLRIVYRSLRNILGATWKIEKSHPSPSQPSSHRHPYFTVKLWKIRFPKWQVAALRKKV